MIRPPRRGLPRREPHRLLLGVQRGPGAQQRHAIVSPERGRLTYRSVVPTLEGLPLKPLRFSRPDRRDRDGQVRSHATGMGGEARVEPTLRQACSRPRPRAQFAFKDSMIHIICNSHYVSHFAAFFIDTGAKISVVESCLWFSVATVDRVGPARTKASDFECHGSVGVVPSRQPAGVVGRHLSQEGSLIPRTGFARAPIGEPTGERAHARSGSRLFRSVGTEDVMSGPHIPSAGRRAFAWKGGSIDAMILPQVHLRKPCYDFSFL